MPRKIAKKERGLFEKVPGSGIWWIRYEIAGIERREKVGEVLLGVREVHLVQHDDVD